MEIVVCDEASGFLSQHVGSQWPLCEGAAITHQGTAVGSGPQCRENTWIWTTGCHKALNLSSQIIF